MLDDNIDSMETATGMETFHKLSDKWTLWAHLPHNTDWSLKSYIPIYTFSTIEETIAVTESLPPVLIENCMLFLMKQGITPMWEDSKNRNGGSFSYKVSSNHVVNSWKELTYRITGASISNASTVYKGMSGITISPKKRFCIIKIWMSNCDHQNPALVTEIKGLQSQGCLFKKHGVES
jgi:hypothetical protein